MSVETRIILIIGGMLLVSLKEIVDGKPVPGDKIAYKYGNYYIEEN